MNIKLSKLWDKLRTLRYRKAFAAAQLKKSVPFQIRTMRVQHGWTQQELAKRAGLPQGTISRCENPNYGELSFNTVLAIANGFDVAFVGKFVPFSELAREFAEYSEESVIVPSFVEEDDQFRREDAVAVLAGPADHETFARNSAPDALVENAPILRVGIHGVQNRGAEE